MADFEKSIVSSILDCVDQVGADLVAHTYANMVHHYADMIWIFAGIYLGFMFLQAMQGKHTFFDLLNITFRLVFILMLTLNYHYFCLFIYDVFTKEPLVMVKAITINGTNAGSQSISQGLDAYLNAGLVHANKLFMMGSWTNPTYCLFGALVLVAAVLGAIYAAGLIILAKCAITILLALSPLFIFCALYDMTRGMFEAYIRHLFTYALIPILSSAILMILFSVTDFVTQFMQQSPNSSFMAIAPFLFMCGIQVYLLAQVFSKASALGSGFALGGFASTMRQMKNNMGSIANAAAGGRVGKSLLGKAAHLASAGNYNRPSRAASHMKRFR
jgi:type IV secretory pathway VirB6-like protein